MSIEVATKQRSIERTTIDAPAAELIRLLSTPEEIGTIFSETFARLRRFAEDSEGALPREPRVQMLEASPNRSEWLVWVADEEKYHGNVELESTGSARAVELRVTLDYEPTLALFERLGEKLTNMQVEHTLRADLAAFKYRLEHGASGEAT